MNQRLHQRLTPLLVLLPLLLVGCEQRGQSDQPRTPQGKSESAGYVVWTASER